MTDGLAITVLGDVDIRVDGKPIDVDTRKAVALVTYLAVTGTSASRDTLASLLWGELDSNRARGALRRTLSVLRKALDNRWLTVESDRVRLEREGLYLDLAEAEELRNSIDAHPDHSREGCADCLARLERAAALYRGEFMAGFNLRDAPEFDNWQLREADAVHQRHTTLLRMLADAASARGDFERAVAAARQRVAMTPLDESAHRQLMTMLVWAGDRAGALRQYRECVRILDEELGVPPLPETSALEERILFDDIPEAPTAPSPVETAARPDVVSGPGSLVGRAAEFAALRRLVEGRGGRVAAIVGAPGVGKSRLAEELADWARTRSHQVARARAYRGEEQLGLVLIGEALRAAVEGWDTPPDLSARARIEASRLVPELGAAPAEPVGSDPGGQGRFLDGVCTALTTLLGAGGVLILDDLQWADDASLDLIAYLLRRPERFPICTVLIWRPTPPERHPLAAIVESHVAGGNGHLIELGPLSDEDTQRLAREAAPDLDEGLTARVAQESEGNPFLTLHLLELIDPATPEFPETPAVQSEMAEARLRGVSELGRQLLSAASIIGRAFDRFDVQAASGRSDEEAVRALDELIQAGLLTDRADGLIDFSHDIVRHHVRDSLTAVRRRLLHDRLADHLLRRHPAGVDGYAGRLAHHLEEAGRLDEAAEQWVAAGDHARSVYAHQEAMAHYETALALGYPDVITVQTAIGDLLTLTGDYTAALDSYRTAAARASGEKLARLEHRLGVINTRLGRWELAVHHYRAATEGLVDPDEVITAYVDWARAARGAGDEETARAVVAEAAAVAETTGVEPPIVAIMQGLVSLDPEQAERRVEEGVELARTTDDPLAHLAGLTTLAQICRRRGDIDAALERVASALRLVKQIGDRHREAALHDLAADLYHDAGDEEKAMEELTLAAALFADVGTGDMEPAIWKTTPW